MIALVNMQAAKDHLRILDTISDDDIALKLLQASAIVMKYCKMATVPDEWTVNSSPITYEVPHDVQSAVLLVLGALYENREASASGMFVGSTGVLTTAVMDLLSSYRDPTLA